jgi:hypothetical protein
MNGEGQLESPELTATPSDVSAKSSGDPAHRAAQMGEDLGMPIAR